MNIEGSGALVSGGASGLGEATVRVLHARGAIVTIADVNAEKGQALADELGLEFVSCDVREEEQVQAAVELAAKTDGGLRIAVSCAGTGWAQKVASSKGPHPLMPFEIIISINLIGTFNLLRFASNAMIANEPWRRRTRRVRAHGLGGGVRRPGRADRLLGIEGRRRGDDAAGGPRSRAVRIA